MSESILVAGGAGYIGAQTCKALAQAGYTPVTLDSLATGYEAAVKWGPLIKADMRDKAVVAETVRTHKIKSCIHFAAYSLVGESTRDPGKYYDNNVVGGLDFINTLVDNGLEHIVFSSTAATYGMPQSDLIDESHVTAPINPYGATKLAYEGVLQWLSKSRGFTYTALRYFNAAGADLDGEIGESHDPETHLIPLICQAALGTGKPLTVFGTDYPTKDGTPIRDYIHVIDLANAHIAAIERLKRGGDSQVYNLGTGEGVTVLEVIQTAEKVLGKAVPHSLGPRREGDPLALVADVRKALGQLDWKPRHSDLETLISSAARWQANKLY